MMKYIISILACAMAIPMLSATEYYVCESRGDDTNDGSIAAPFKTISAAAATACAGDVVTVYAGTYREWVSPQNGGESDSKRVVYQAAKGEKVFIKGSELASGWTKQEDGTWMIRLNDDFFKGHQSFKVVLEGDWFRIYDHHTINHTADIYINGKSMFEADCLQKVVDGSLAEGALDAKASSYRWFCVNDDEGTTVWANFHEFDPNEELVEVSVRPACFYPDKQGVNYITVRGFDISQAATQWAPPTAEQIGMVAPHWCKGWIIENNIIHDTKCNGITLGKERSTGHNEWSKNRSKDGAIFYTESVFAALKNNWNKDHVGSHIVRNNEIYHCEQTGICGSMACAFSEIAHNYIHDVWVKRQFYGAEIAGVKFHGPIDTYIHHNIIKNCRRGIWLDWMTQGTRVSSNVLTDNSTDDIFLEVNHGPFIIDNNICLSAVSLRNQSQGGAYVHNFFCGAIQIWVDLTRFVPYHFHHSTMVKGIWNIIGGDDRFYNNIFMPIHQIDDNNKGLQVFNVTQLANKTYAQGNVYYNGAKEITGENAISISQPAMVSLEDRDGKYFLNVNAVMPEGASTDLITAGMLGSTMLSEIPFSIIGAKEDAIDVDYFGNKREVNPTPGPFEEVLNASMELGAPSLAPNNR